MRDVVILGLAHGERKTHFVDIAAVDLLVEIAARGGAGEIGLHIDAAVGDIEAQSLITEAGDHLSAVVIIHNHVGHIALVESVTVDNFLVFHAVALP